MITLKTIEKEVLEIRKSLEDRRTTTSQQKKHIKRLKYINEVKYYLETNPNELFLKTNLSDIKKRMVGLSSGFGEWLKSIDKKDSDPKKLKTRFNSEMGIGKMKSQIKTLEFILSK